MSIVEDVQFPSLGSAPRVTLHGKLHRFPDETPRPSVLLCHPSSNGEAHYNHPIIRKLTGVLHDEGFNVLRFNMRGIQPSGGEISQGAHEPDDVRGALEFFAGLPAVDPDRLYVVGHSFGAAMGLSVASRDDRVKGGIGLGFPLRALDPSIPGALRHYATDRAALLDSIRNWNRPKFFVTGDSDRSGPPLKMAEYFLSMTGPKTFVVVGESDHYFGQGERRNLDHPALVQATEHVRRTLLDWSRRD